jgi:hypothetical protein
MRKAVAAVAVRLEVAVGAAAVAGAVEAVEAVEAMEEAAGW